MRIGITQRVVEVPHYQERRDSLDQRWAHVIIQLGGFPVPLSNGVGDVAGYLAALDLAGVILSGGNDISCLEGTRDTAPERDEFEGKLVDTCLASGIALLGVCRGMQVLNLHFGGRLRRVEGHVASHHAVRLQGRPHEVNSFHSWGMEACDLSPELLATATAEDGTVEAFVHPSLACRGVMWHPEREPELRPWDDDLFRRLFCAERRTS
jgi:gamma-glutamyl-gamma-aminobutyrate hydrolase PuuD